MSIHISSDERTFCLSGGNTTYILHRDAENRLLCPYWGARLPDGSFTYNPDDYFSFISFDLPALRLPYDLPTCGTGWYGTPAVSALNAHGDDVTDLRFVSFRVSPGKPSLPGLPALYTESPEEADTLVILLEDALTGLQVESCYTVFAASGAVARSLNIRNAGSAPLRLAQVQPASGPLWDGRLDLVEMIVKTVPVARDDHQLGAGDAPGDQVRV